MAKAWVSGSENVLRWHELNARSPYYSIWSGKQILFSWPDSDMEAGRDLLRQNLDIFEAQGITDEWVLKVHPAVDKNNEITNVTPYNASLNFRPAPLGNAASYASMQGVEFPNNPKLQALAGKLELIEAKLDSMGNEPPAGDEIGWMGTVNKLMEIPGFSEAAAPMIAGIVGALGKALNLPMPDASQTAAAISQAAAASNEPAGHVSGISDDQEDKIDQALDILQEGNPKLGDDLLILAEIRKQNPDQFNSFLQMLRSNGN